MSSSILWVGCGKPGQEKGDQNQDATEQENGTGDPLYDEVMKLHDEGMEKMDEVYRLKEGLKKKISAAKELTADKKKQIEDKIFRLDSASRGMMSWMHNFHPENDSLDDQAYHEYMQRELDKVKKVRDDILAAIDRAKEE